MPTSDGYTLVNDMTTESSASTDEMRLFDDYYALTSGKLADLNAQLVTALREKHPELTVTTVSRFNCNLIQFASTGYATAELDLDGETVIRVRGYVGPAHRGGVGGLSDGVYFARYHYKWANEDFLLYTVGNIQYVLKEPSGARESPLTNSAATDALLLAIGAWLNEETPSIYVYDRYWIKSTKLWEQVSKAKWSDVILDPKMKKALTEVSGKFFDSREIYEDYGVPWKRGLIFHGPVGNGKTISLKALMHTLYDRTAPVVTLYVKTAPSNWDIKNVFEMARRMTPCMLVLEDIDTIVTDSTRSYFFNEVDGIESNDGILMIATTNHLDQLDPGLSSRPSRFDRKYLFPLPDKGQRALYADYWRNKLKEKDHIEFPKKLCKAMAGITDDFSFAYLKEAFVATLLELARNRNDDVYETDSDSERGCALSIKDGEEDPLDKYELWRVFKEQVEILRKEMGDGKGTTVRSGMPMSAGEEPLPDLSTLTVDNVNMTTVTPSVRLHGEPQVRQAPIAFPPHETIHGIARGRESTSISSLLASPINQSMVPNNETSARIYNMEFDPTRPNLGRFTEYE